MKKLLTLILLAPNIIGLTQPCISNASSTFEASQLRMSTNNKGNIGSMLEFPKRTQKEIDQGKKGKFLVFDGGIHLVSILNNRLYKSEASYSLNENRHFTTGPINLKTGDADWQNCEVFDKIWYIDRVLVDNFIVLVKNSFNFPISKNDIPKEILEWPAKGNKLYTKVPIKDDLAPFYDFNDNEIYDPEYGDFPVFKGDQAQFTVINDLYNQKFRKDTVLGLEIHMMVYNYNYTYPNSEKNALYYDVKINKKTMGNLDSFIFSLFLDPDLGYFTDDFLGCHHSSNSVFTYNGDSYDEPSFNGSENYGYNPPVFVSSFIKPSMSSYAPYFNGGGLPLNYPYALKFYLGIDSLRFPYSGNPANLFDTNTMSASLLFARDWKYLQNTQHIKLSFNQPINYEFVLYAHQFNKYVSRPNIYDSVLNPLDSLKKGPKIKDCNISFTAKIIPCNENAKNGKINLENIIAARPYLAKWSNFETSESLSNKDSGKYRVVIIDANNCMKDSTFYIPLITKGTGGIAQTGIDNISIFPNPFENQLTIKNLNQLKIENIYIYDVVGKLVYHNTMNSRNETSELGLKTLPKGNYQMSIATEHGVKNFKITK